MKALALLFLIGSATAVLAADNLLKNGDFSEGINYWEGDCHSIDSTTFDSSDANPPTSGVIVKLRGSEWTRVTQNLEAKRGNYLLTLTYVGSPDLRFSARSDDYMNMQDKLSMPFKPFNIKEGQWIALIFDPAAKHGVSWSLTPPASGTGAIKVSIPVKIKTQAEDQTFIVSFPPGDGYINLLDVSLTPQG